MYLFVIFYKHIYIFVILRILAVFLNILKCTFTNFIYKEKYFLVTLTQQTALFKTPDLKNAPRMERLHMK